VRVEVRELGFGRGVFAAEDLPAGAVIASYAGPSVPWSEVPGAEVAHVIKNGARWVIPGSPARFVNHGCEPNCDVDDDLAIFALRAIPAGEELTIDYHTARRADVEADPAAYFWHPRWSFTCRCGAPTCRGRVEGWRLV
jgi:SET domain-containing protein